MSWYDTHVLAVTQETPQDRTFTLETPGAIAEECRAFVPGQFLLIRDPDAEPLIQRAYSISSAPGEALEVTVRDMGSFGHTFYDFGPGRRILMQAPRGKFTLDVRPDEIHVLAAGGSGVTPFRSFVRHLRTTATAQSVVLLHSAQQAAQLIFRAEFESHAQACDWFRYVPTVTRDAGNVSWGGRTGRIDEPLLRESAAAPQTTNFYACGPSAFVRSVLALAAELGIPMDRLRREQWG